MAGLLYDGKLSPSDLDKDLMLKTYSQLSDEVERGWGRDYYKNPLASNMRQNVIEFAGHKTHAQLERIAAELTDGTGKKIPRNEFVEKAQKIGARYNGAYLDVEKRTSLAMAQSARNWQQYVKDRDIFKNLRYRTMGDSDVRDSHAMLEGLVRPVGDSEWGRIAPPNGDGCRCFLEQTNDATTQGVPNIAIEERFAFNPGMTGEVFNREYSYYQVPEKTRDAIVAKTELTKPLIPYKQTIKVDNSNVFVHDFADRNDLSANMKAAKLVARQTKTDIYIRHHINTQKLVRGVKNPELGIGKSGSKADLKTFDYDNGGTLPKYIDNAMKSLRKQQCEHGVLDVSGYDGKDTISILSARLKGLITPKMNRNIKSVFIIRAGKVVRLTRKDILTGNHENLLKEL